MDVFAFRDFLVRDYVRFTRSFVRIRAEDIKRHVDDEYAADRFWPAPTIQLNPAFVPGGDRHFFFGKRGTTRQCVYGLPVLSARVFAISPSR
jgi:hypothetical protein